MVQPLLAPEGGLAPALVNYLETTVKSISDELYDIQLAIHEKPELAWREEFAHDTCTAYMEKKGWKVTRHAYGLKTAWEAVYQSGQGGPVVGFNSEMDALQGIGHACGHNLICVAGIAAAIATANLLKSLDISGKVILLGTPAEEVGGGKYYLLKEGAYKDMEACMMVHPSSKGNGGQIVETACIAAFSAKFIGVSAHAGAFPERGVNALDAAVAAYTNIALLRQQVPSSHRITQVIRGSEQFITNTIPHNAGLWVGVRAPSAKDVAVAVDKLLNCLKAGALSSGCQIEISREHLYMELENTDALGDYYKSLCETQWGHEGYTVVPEKSTAGTDFGNVSYHLPCVHPVFLLPDAAEGDVPHSDTFAQYTGLRSSLDAALKSSVGIAGLGARMVLDRPWAKAVRENWEAKMEAIDGHTTLATLSKVFEAYPPSKDLDKAFCACH